MDATETSNPKLAYLVWGLREWLVKNPGPVPLRIPQYHYGASYEEFAEKVIKFLKENTPPPVPPNTPMPDHLKTLKKERDIYLGKLYTSYATNDDVTLLSYMTAHSLLHCCLGIAESNRLFPRSNR